MSYPLAVDIDSWHVENALLDSVRDSLDGYTFESCVESTPLGEVWQVRSANGRQFLAHFLSPSDRAVIENFLARIKSMTFPGLAPFSVLKTREQHTILLTPLNGVTLKEKFQEYWNGALPGIPRPELLDYLGKVARTLDAVYNAHRLQHLALNPKRILIQENQVEITGFGLAELMWGPLKQPILSLNPQYSAPEIFRGRVSPNCDQCSLALMYVALLTGVHPMRNWERAGNGCMQPKTLNVSMLSSADREIVLKALNANPRQRFVNATAFIEALERASAEQATCSLTKLLVQSRIAPVKPIYSLESFVQSLVSVAMQQQVSNTSKGIRFKIEQGRKIEHRTEVGLPPARLFERIGEFCQSVNASPAHFDGQRVLLHVTVPSTFWRRLLNKPAGLEIEVQIAQVAKDQSEIQVVVRPFGCGREQAAQLLQEEGVRLLEAMQQHLSQRANLRRSPRFACQERIVLSPVLYGHDLAAPIEGYTKDVSTSGVGLIVPRPIDATHLYLNLPQLNALAPYAGLAEIVRTRPIGDGWFEVGAQFAIEIDRKQSTS